MAIIDSNFKSIKEFLASAPYFIPEYQRGYSWEKEQLEDLWLDFIHLYEDDILEKHFLGQIVVHHDSSKGEKFIIDGQQRTSTSIILLDAFRIKFSQLYDELNEEDLNYNIDDIIEEINYEYIGKKTSREDKTKLFLGEADKKFFEEYIQSQVNNKINVSKSKLSRSEKRIYDASKYFLQKLEEQISNLKSNLEKYTQLEKLYKCYTNSMQIMYVETNNLNEAFIIFETLNARGKSLETSDLLKNHIFRMSGNQINENKNEWNRMIDHLGSSDATKFIRSYWNSKYKFVRTVQLYKMIRSKVNSKEEAYKLVTELSKYASLYSALDKPTESTYFKNSKINEKLGEIHDLNAKTFFPIMIAMELKNTREDDVLRVLSAIEILIVRNFVVAGKTANSYEITFSKIAKSIYDKELSSVQEIIKEIRENMISDDEFENSFKTFSIKQKPAIRYMYRKIANHNEKEIQVITDNNKVHIEHIMPEKIGGWGIAKEEHAEYLTRFGNLTLLGDEYNRSASNSSFEKKKEIYRDSKIEITRKLSDLNKWDIKSIEDRQSELAKVALNIWKK